MCLLTLALSAASAGALVPHEHYQTAFAPPRHQCERYMWPRLLAASRSHAELWSLPLLLIATALPSFDVLCMNRNARVPRAANRGKRAVSHHNRKAKRPRKGTPTLNKRGR